MRDGYAVRSADLPGELGSSAKCAPGERFAGEVGPGQAVEIMTGAPMPAGADAVVMVEHTARDDGRVRIDGSAEPRQFINPQGCEARGAARWSCAPAQRLGLHRRRHAGGVRPARVSVYRRPVVAIVATGDEIVEVGETPAEFQIRNSNA